MRDCIRSVQRQTRPPDEILIVDNASTDSTPVVGAALSDDPRVKYVYCEPASIPRARNKALDSCGCDAICFLDDDSEADPTWLAELVDVYENHPEVAAVQGYLANFYSGNVVATLAQFQRDLFVNNKVSGADVETPAVVATGNLSFRMQLVREEGIRFNEVLRIGEDMDVGRQILEKGHRILYAENAAVRHKWKTSTSAYLNRRFRTGLCAGRMCRLSADRRQPSFASDSGLSKRDIFRKAWAIARPMRSRERALFLGLLFTGNLTRKLGAIYGSFFG